MHWSSSKVGISTNQLKHISRKIVWLGTQACNSHKNQLYRHNNINEDIWVSI